MPRPKKCRRVCQEPAYNSFSPGGIPSDGTIVLSVDEYEVLRLLDYEKLNQEECALKIGVARTTITEMYIQARYKVADCLVNGKQMVIDGGNYQLCGRKASCSGYRNCNFAENGATNNKILPRESGVMRIAVTYDNGEIFQHFGHTESFKLYDVEDNEVVAEQVVSTNGQGHGALAGFLFGGKVDVLICGGIGGGAQVALAEAGIKLYGGVSGNADEAVQAFIEGNLGYNPDVKCDHHEHEEGHTCGEHGCGNHGCH